MAITHPNTIIPFIQKQQLTLFFYHPQKKETVGEKKMRIIIEWPKDGGNLKYPRTAMGFDINYRGTSYNMDDVILEADIRTTANIRHAIEKRDAIIKIKNQEEDLTALLPELLKSIQKYTRPFEDHSNRTLQKVKKSVTEYYHEYNVVLPGETTCTS